MKNLIAAIIAVLLVMPVQARTALSIVGVVTYVSDGDTVWVKPNGGGEALDVRIQGIDAPESCQDYGHVAQQALSQHVLHKTVTLTTKARDKYGRVIARISFGNQGHQDVGAWMVANGHAWSYHFHRNAGPYAREEMMARLSGRGLWGNGYPMEHREFRRRTKCHKPRK
jgi:micrococcal nuclease